MLEHRIFRQFHFDDIPLDQDLMLMDERWISEFEREWLKVHEDGTGDPYSVGYISPAAAHSIGDDWLELSWYPNTYQRFHEVPVFLPRSAVVACVDLWEYGTKPIVFVHSEWLTELHERPLAAFAMIDAIDVKRGLQSGKLLAGSLHELRSRIDAIADRNPNFAFISFADTLLVKQVWSVGHVHSSIRYTYSPEMLFPVVGELFNAFEDALGLRAYGVVTQGINAYSDDLALHKSSGGNHISLNTLGLPFAQLMAIENAAREAIRSGLHGPAELYLDATFYRSLKFAPGFKRDAVPMHGYKSPMTKSLQARYATLSYKHLVANLASPSGP